MSRTCARGRTVTRYSVAAPEVASAMGDGLRGLGRSRGGGSFSDFVEPRACHTESMATKAPMTARPPTRRRFPRADVTVKVHLTVGEGPNRSFDAMLPSKDLSVSGVFFESTFFLKIG